MIKPFHNLHLKILALLSAIVLWFFVVGIENTVYSLPETLEVRPVGIGKTVSVGNVLPKVKLYLRVDEEILKTLTRNDFELTVDLTGLNVGEHTVPVSAVSKNTQVRVLKMEPAELDVKIVPVAEKEVDVTVSFLGSPGPGYAVKEVTSTMKKVKISGAQSVIDNIDSVKAELLLDGTETRDFEQTVTLQVPQTSAISSYSVKIVPEQMLVSAVIMTETQQKVVQIRPVITGAADGDAIMDQIVIEPSSVTIQGEEKYLRAVSSLETAPVDVQSLINSTAPLNLKLILPENVLLLNPNGNITISLKAKPDEQKSILAPIVFTRQNPDFRVKKTIPSEITVTVSGPASVIRNLRSEDITVNINLQNVSGAGALLINTKDIIIPAGLEIISFQPTQIELETM